jgi:hypothetical protein
MTKPLLNVYADNINEQNANQPIFYVDHIIIFINFIIFK